MVYNMKCKALFYMDTDLKGNLEEAAKDGRSMSWHLDKALRAYLKPANKTKVKKERSDSVFIKPTVDQVAAFVSENRYDINPEGFIDYCKNNGWKLANGNPMKDWQAAIRTWVRRKQERAVKSGSLIERTERKAKASISDAKLLEDAMASNGQNLFAPMDD